MKPIDLTKLIEGLLVVIFLAVAIGKFDALRSFAVKEAAQSLRGWDNHAFFPKTYQKLVGPGPKGARPHLREGMDSHEGRGPVGHSPHSNPKPF